MYKYYISPIYYLEMKIYNAARVAPKVVNVIAISFYRKGQSKSRAFYYPSTHIIPQYDFFFTQYPSRANQLRFLKAKYIRYFFTRHENREGRKYEIAPVFTLSLRISPVKNKTRPRQARTGESRKGTLLFYSGRKAVGQL